jgi:hypothetical protein
MPPEAWRAGVWLRSTYAALVWLNDESWRCGGHRVRTELQPAEVIHAGYRYCAGGCGAIITKPRSRFCTDCRAKRDAASKRQSKRRAKLPKVYIADDSCCGHYALERMRLFAKLGKAEAIRIGPWLKNARCPQCVTWAQVNVKEAPPRVILADEDWFKMGFHIVKAGRGGTWDMDDGYAA